LLGDFFTGFLILGIVGSYYFSCLRQKPLILASDAEMTKTNRRGCSSPLIDHHVTLDGFRFPLFQARETESVTSSSVGKGDFYVSG